MWMGGYSKNTFTVFALDLYEWLVFNSPSKGRKGSIKASMQQWEALG